MDHKYAIENHTAERYLLHELNEEQRDAYEEHFFSCSACAEEVKMASEFLESARQVVQDDVRAQLYSHAARRSIWGSWLNFRSMLHPMPAMACALLILGTTFGIYQNTVMIPGLRQATLAQAMTSEPIVLGAAHGGSEDVGRGVIGRPFRLRFSLPPGDYASYKVDIRTESKINKFSFNFSPQNIPVEIWLASDALQAGKYFVVIQGVDTNQTGSGVKGEPQYLPFEVVLHK